MTTVRTIRSVWIAVGLGTLAVVAAVLSAPWLRSRNEPLAAAIYACFSPFCHQSPARSFSVFGYPLAVCARCFGIYLGFFAGWALYPAVRGFRRLQLPRIRTFLALTAPIALDAGAHILSIWSSGRFPRFVTGFLWGLVLPLYLITGVAELVLSRRGGPGRDGLESTSPNA